ncbi:MAG: efflux RND transporter permease subunit [Chloroflexi bacterium]|nr:efflux RND transporter permease subunit [Chloroflexota bacterium]
MRWIPAVGAPINELANSNGNAILSFPATLLPGDITLNIMTLSGLTVAIGRVVDDSIVVLENSYRYIQQGYKPVDAVIAATKEVAVAIFAATATTMAVFLPLGLVGGLISSFFLPFGLTVTYALAASFLVSITVVPVLTVLLIRRENIPEHKETAMQRWYTPALEWALHNRLLTLGITLVVFMGSMYLMSQLPQNFIPALGEPTININVTLPAGTDMAETDGLVREPEVAAATWMVWSKWRSEIGSAGAWVLLAAATSARTPPTSPECG